MATVSVPTCRVCSIKNGYCQKRPCYCHDVGCTLRDAYLRSVGA